MSKAAPQVRYAEVERETRATRVQVVLDLDGGTRRDISTGIHFFDHMLIEMAFHAQFDVGVVTEGDLEVDDHHSVMDTGIVLGQAIGQAIEGEQGIVRFGHATVACDDALVRVALDLRGHGSCFFDVPFTRERLGGLTTQAIEPFFRNVAVNSLMTLHATKLAGTNDHHVCEALFKAFGLALFDSVKITERGTSSPTKGSRP